MLISAAGDAAPPGRAGQKAHLHEIRLVNVLQRDGLLVDGGRQRVKTHRPAAVVFNNAGQHTAIHRVKAEIVHLQRGKRRVRNALCDHTARHDLREIPHAAEHPVGDSGRAAGAAGDLHSALRLDLPKFTLIGATTRSGQLSAPLRDRFGVTLRLELYSPEELCGIVMRSADILGVPIETDGAMEIARRSRGTPRIANRMLRRVRDFAQVRADGVITKPVADEALSALEIDYLGLDPIDRRMLRAIVEHYGGGPVGLETLAATIGEEAVTLEDVYEPYLMQLGFLSRTPRGRCATRKACEHLHLPVPGELSAGALDQLTI